MRILQIDLSSRTSSLIDDAGLRADSIGGVGLGTSLLYRHTARDIDAFDPGNHLFFSVGGFVGTNIPTASRCEATAISPLSGYFGSTSSGGMLAAAIRFSGLDGLWVTGTSDLPVYVTVGQQGVRFHDAASIWGRDTYETIDTLKATEGKEAEIACIGQAGERRVRFASIQNGYYHSFGRCGLGAVMGSKHLKALCFLGGGEVAVSDRKRFADVSGRMRERILASSTFGYTRRYGSMVVCDVYNKLGMLPSHNFREGSVDDWEKTRGRKVFEEKYKERDIACFACPIGCMHWSTVKEGPRTGYETKGLEVTFAFEFGAKLGIKDISEIFLCGEACNRLGMDVISAASVAAYVIELFEHGLLGEKELGFVPRHGDFATIHRLIEMIGRREGPGMEFGEGLKRAKTRFDGSAGFAYEIKGMEMPVRDPRGRFDSWVLGYLTNPRGGDHLRARTPVDDLKAVVRSYEHEPLILSKEEVDNLDMPEGLKRAIFGEAGDRIHIPAMTKYGEELVLLLNSFGMCIRTPVLRTIGPSLLAEGFSSFYGQEMDEHALLHVAEKLFNMEHLFNLERGMKVEEFRFPDKFYTDPVCFAGGQRPSLDRSEVDRVLKQYFGLRGWDESARLTDETKKRLGIDTWKNV